MEALDVGFHRRVGEERWRGQRIGIGRVDLLHARRARRLGVAGELHVGEEIVAPHRRAVGLLQLRAIGVVGADRPFTWRRDPNQLRRDLARNFRIPRLPGQHAERAARQATHGRAGLRIEEGVRLRPQRLRKVGEPRRIVLVLERGPDPCGRRVREVHDMKSDKADRQQAASLLDGRLVMKRTARFLVHVGLRAKERPLVVRLRQNLP